MRPLAPWSYRLVALSLVSLSLPGCLVNTELYEQRRAALTDADGDGATPEQGDCDDANAAVGPSAPELCNGFDDNCDGRIDERAEGNDVYWRADADGDGFAADSATPVADCSSPGPGWVADAGDCDDTDGATWPGAPEACDGRDNDCDGAADEEPTVSPPTWYPDADGDGHGSAGGGVSQCLPPERSGWVLVATDCDDGDAEIHPDAPERCNGADDDCDGTTDEGPFVDGSGGWYPDRDGDGFGDDGAATCVFASGYVDVGGDCDDTDEAINPSAVELCNDGVDNDCDGSPGACVWDASVDMTAHVRIHSSFEDENFGFTAAGGDLDGDGREELIFGAVGAWSDDAMLGAAYVFRGPLAADGTAADAAWIFWGEHDRSGAGKSVAVHDLDGDGFADLQVGAASRRVAGVQWAGTLYTMFGPISGGGALEERADWKLEGTAFNDSIGYRAYALGDMDGDGLADFGTGYESAAYRGLDEAGVLYVYTSVGSGTEAAVDAATAVVYGALENDQLGSDAAGLDYDGDGVGDLVVGAQTYDAGAVTGAALVFAGPVSGQLGSDDADSVYTGEAYASYAGREVDTVGDINGDGYEDLLVGAPFSGEGAAYLLWGGAVLGSGPLADAQVKFRGSRATKHLGYSVEGLGDLNEDGWPDIFLSEEDNADGDIRGYVFFGPLDTPATRLASSADVTFTGESNDKVYDAVFTTRDATGDDVTDLVVASYKYGTSWWWNGVAYIVSGVGY